MTTSINYVVDISDASDFIDHIKDHYGDPSSGWSHKEKVIIHAALDDVMTTLINISRIEGDESDNNIDSAS